MNAKLEAIAAKAAENLQALLKEGGDTILDAWDSCVEEAQAQETAPKLRLGFTITLDLDKNAATYDLAFGVRYKLSAAGTIPDPTQPELPGVEGDDTQMEIRTPDGKVVKATVGDLKRVSAKLRGN